MCDCKEKIELVKITKAFQATEEWCPIHGYQTDCYRCNPSLFSTELCLKHCNKTIPESITLNGLFDKIILIKKGG